MNRFKRLVLVSLAMVGLAFSSEASALTFTFTIVPDNSQGEFPFDEPPITGIIHNAVNGANYGFDLAATITGASIPGTLGGGYVLSFLISTPAFIIQNGQVVFANAVFGRSGGGYDYFLTISALGGNSFLTGLSKTNHVDTFTGRYDQENDGVSFGPVLDDSAPAVPEPSTWAMMIAGFGLAGAALRRSAPSVKFA